MRRVIFVLVALLIATGSSLWAAGTKESAKPAEKVELKAIWWGSQTRHEGTIKTIELYQKKNPNVSMVYEFAAWGDYWTKVTTMAAGGQLPDVMQQDYAYVAEWQKRNLLHGLDDYAQSKVLDFSTVSDSLLSSGRIGGKLYAVNLGSNSEAVILDTDAFQKAGVPLPKSDWTWEDFERIALDLHQKLGIYGHGPGLDNIQLWKNIYLGLGQWAYSRDGTALGYTDDQPFVNHLSMMLRLMKAGAIPSKQEAIADWGDGDNPEQTPIIQGKGAMQFLWSNQAFAVNKASGEGRHFVLMSLPRTKRNGPSANYIKASMFFSVSNQSKNPAEAAKFINYFTNDVDANKILMAERGVPISSEIRTALSPMVPPITQEVFNFVGWVAKEASPTPPPDPVKSTEIEKNVYKPEVIEKVLFGVITPEEGAKLLHDKATELLAAPK
jgi:multiple sugar transport system substrate-binding protein